MLQSERLYRVVGIVGATFCLTISFIYLGPRLIQWSVLPDFTVFWTASRLALVDARHVYDTTQLTAAQSWAANPSFGPRPFPYPPTALLVFIPFGLLPFWVAYWSWLLISLIAFWSAARRIATGWAVPLSMGTPHVILVLILGQTTLIVGSMIIWGLILIRKRPVLAGILFGIVAGLKPQSVVLAPVALVAAGHWRVLGVSVVSFGAMAMASLAFGSGVWWHWYHALGSFPAVIEWHGLNRLGATPWMAARVIGLEPMNLLMLQIAGIAAGIAAVWWAFKYDDLSLRLSMLVFGGLLASPYAMRYDLATLSPVFCMGLLSGTLRGLLMSIPLFALHTLTILTTLVLSLLAQVSQRVWPVVPVRRTAPVT